MDTFTCEAVLRCEVPFDIYVLASSRACRTETNTQLFLSRLEENFIRFGKSSQSIGKRYTLEYLVATMFCLAVKSQNDQIIGLFLDSKFVCKILHDLYSCRLLDDERVEPVPTTRPTYSLSAEARTNLNAKISPLAFFATARTFKTESKSLELVVSEFPEICDMFDEYGRTPLHLAAMNDNTDCFSMLISCRNINLFARDSKNEKTCFETACEHGSIPVLQLLLLTMGPDGGQTSIHPLFYGIRHKEVVNLLLTNEPPPRFQPRDLKGHTPLHYAAKLKKNSEVIELLLKAGYDVRVTDGYGNLPIHYACYIGDVNNVRLLAHADLSTLTLKHNSRYPFERLISEADPLRDNFSRWHYGILPSDSLPMNSIEIAASRSFWNVCGCLLKCGAHIPKAFLNSSLHSSVKSENVNGCLLLLEYGADPNIVVSIKTFESALRLAARSKNIEVAKILLAFGAKPHSVPYVLHDAVNARCYDMVKLWLEGLSQEEALKIREDSLVLWSIAKSESKALFPMSEIIKSRFPIYFTADIVNCLDQDKATPIFYCVRDRSVESDQILDCLIQHGANINAQNRFGQTPLHCAILANNLDSVKKLLSHDADVSLKGEGNKTALDLIQSLGLSDWGYKGKQPEV
ncbi:hypothetical protein HK098_004619 [Nowakowskiella sp. JEL0407]|nr:hypothetical protein HK098_004619 [Nowakowskiella sp. JEL0407]